MRWVVGGKAVERQAVSTSQMGRFGTALWSDVPLRPGNVHSADGWRGFEYSRLFARLTPKLGVFYTNGVSPREFRGQRAVVVQVHALVSSRMNFLSFFVESIRAETLTSIKALRRDSC
jgi:hypothetical protein